MAKSIPFSLITPVAIAFEGETSLVIATGTEGELGILAGHSPFLTALKPGVLRADVLVNGVPQRLIMAISAGFLQALPDRITMNVDTAVKPEAVDIEATRSELELSLQRQTATLAGSLAFAREQEIIDFANAKLAIRA